uniref:Uncharacterized protein n=1 Tax=Takifugu rubripes TaxID=31033 RepID=A0A3B5K7N0_TAKRU
PSLLTDHHGPLVSVLPQTCCCVLVLLCIDASSPEGRDGTDSDFITKSEGRRRHEDAWAATDVETCSRIQGEKTNRNKCTCERDGTDAHKLPVALALSVTPSSTPHIEVCFLFPK